MGASTVPCSSMCGRTVTHADVRTLVFYAFYDFSVSAVRLNCETYWVHVSPRATESLFLHYDCLSLTHGVSSSV